MSHFKERKEKNCLNCHAQLVGRYCHKCGQENIEPQESFWHLLTHFVFDIFHFDGKFFTTMKDLVFKPGFLTREYAKGRRASYLHPIRMYVFTSAIFFIIYFSFVASPAKISADQLNGNDFGALQARINALNDSLSKGNDSLQNVELANQITAIEKFLPAELKNQDSSKSTNPKEDSLAKAIKNGNVLNLRNPMPVSISAYEAAEKKLPVNEQDGFFMRNMMYHAIDINIKYHDKREEAINDFIEKFYHTLPQMLVVTLPFAALILQLLYIRKRKEIYYSEHVVFLLHVTIAIFIALLFYYGLLGLFTISHFFLFDWLSFAALSYAWLYGLFAMYGFYRQGFMKTSIKYFLLLFLILCVSVLILLIFLFTTLYRF
ncbi:MAG: DUF3667 domain-containing protein [Bacteroidota bacterium]